MGFAWGVGALAGFSIGGSDEMVRVRRHEDAQFGFQSNLLQGHWGENCLRSIPWIDPNCEITCAPLQEATIRFDEQLVLRPTGCD
jgi:hypothetical protein